MATRARPRSRDLPETARAAILAATATILAHEPGTRAGKDPEELHKLRVGSRRLRAALSTFAPLLPAKPLARARRRLRELTRALAAVRDLDVHAGLLRDAIARERDPAARAAIEYAASRLAGRRAREQRRLRKALDRLALAREARCLESLAESAREPGAPAAVDLAAAAIERRLERAFGGLAASLEEDDAEALHERRIRVKRLRYSVEALAPLLVADFADALAGLAKRLQTALGRHHDAVTLAVALERERARCERKGKEELAAGLARAIAHAEAARADAFDAYRRVARRALEILPAAATASGAPDRAKHRGRGEPDERPAPAR